VSTVAERVEVRADSPVVETTRAEQATRIDSASLRALPNNGRSFLSLMQLTPA
jgi:hypothetical protein